MSLSKIGIYITILYIGMIVILRFSSFNTLTEMKLNEFGDFLAGVFGPLMLLWLIVSVYIQKQELGQNTEVLKRQADELEKSVEQHKDLVKLTNQQLEVDTKAVALQEEIFQKQDRDFTYIFERSDRMLVFTLDEFTTIEPYNEKGVKINEYKFSINLGEIISHLIEINKSEFSNDSLKKVLKENCLKLINKTIKDSIYNMFFEIIDLEDIAKELLICGLIKSEYVPEQRTVTNTSSSTRSAFYRYELTEKLYNYRYWLEINNKFTADLKLHYHD